MKRITILLLALILLAGMSGCSSTGGNASRGAHPFEGEVSSLERWHRLDPYDQFNSPSLYWRNFSTSVNFWDPHFSSYHPFWADPWIIGLHRRRFGPFDRSSYGFHGMHRGFGFGAPSLLWPYGYTSLYGGFWNHGYQPPLHDGRGRFGRNGGWTREFDDRQRQRGNSRTSGGNESIPSFEARFPQSVDPQSSHRGTLQREDRLNDFPSQQRSRGAETRERGEQPQ